MKPRNRDPDRTLMALAHPTRRALLQRLSHGEARVTQLAAPFRMSLEAVSKHLRVLERARLVRRRRIGREHLFSFEPAPLERIADWIAATRSEWTARLDALADVLASETPATSVSPTSPRPPRGASS
jgi:DNA-binding transcriptional ArsR family regulator